MESHPCPSPASSTFSQIDNCSAALRRMMQMKIPLRLLHNTVGAFHLDRSMQSVCRIDVKSCQDIYKRILPPKRCTSNSFPPSPSPEGSHFRKVHQGRIADIQGQCWRWEPESFGLLESTGLCGSCLLGPRPGDSKCRTCCSRY